MNTGEHARNLPHLVMIMTDQHRADFAAESGLGLDTMPVLNSVARGGVAFGRAYTSYPACVPARTSLLTGRFPTTHRVRQNSTAQHAYYSQDLIDVLRSSGYQLHFVGKPHMHRGPEDFDSYSGPYWHTSGPARESADAEFDQWLVNLDHGVCPQPTPFPLERQLPHRIVTDALEVMARADQEEDPMFLWVSFPEPHNPYQVPEPYFSMFPENQVPERLAGPESMGALTGKYRWLRNLAETKRPGYDRAWRRYRANYLGMLRLIDDQIARLTAALADQSRDVVIIFVSDHGDYVGEYGLQRKGAGMSESLMRIPLIFSGAGITGGQQRDECVSIVDVLPTICELLDAEIPAGVQGRSLAPLLRGEASPVAEFDSVYAELGYGGMAYGEQERPSLHFPYDGPTFDELNTVTHSGGERMVRSGEYKLIMDDSGAGQLFDLAADPAELHNLYDDPAYADIRHQLEGLLIRWLIRVADDLPVGDYRPNIAEHNWRWAPQPVSEAPPESAGS